MQPFNKSNEVEERNSVSPCEQQPVSIKDHTIRNFVEADTETEDLSDGSSSNEVADFDGLVADALLKMTGREREELYLEQHGIPVDEVGETPSLIKEKLSEMMICLVRIKNRYYTDSLSSMLSGKRWRQGVQAFILAESMNAEFVQDPIRRLSFLRAERMDAKKAAERYIYFFEIKLQCYGTSKLTKDITYDDLDQVDIDCIQSGILQISPFRDNANRIVFFLYLSHIGDLKEKTIPRCVLYLLQTKDMGIFKHSGVLVMHHIGPLIPEKFNKPAHDFCAPRTLDSYPIRITAIHFAYSDPKYRIMMALALALKPPSYRAKVKQHYGPVAHCTLGLGSYGIPRDLVPVNDNGEIKKKSMLEWLASRRLLEKSPAYESIEYPSNEDVLFGKGIIRQRHSGNLCLQFWVEEALVDYNAETKRKGKSDIIDKMAKKVYQSGGRFLAKESGVWRAVSEEMAHVKISHLFRNRRSFARRRAADENGTGKVPRPQNVYPSIHDSDDPKRARR